MLTTLTQPISTARSVRALFLCYRWLQKEEGKATRDSTLIRVKLEVALEGLSPAPARFYEIERGDAPAVIPRFRRASLSPGSGVLLLPLLISFAFCLSLLASSLLISGSSKRLGANRG